MREEIGLRRRVLFSWKRDDAHHTTCLILNADQPLGPVESVGKALHDLIGHPARERFYVFSGSGPTACTIQDEAIPIGAVKVVNRQGSLPDSGFRG